MSMAQTTHLRPNLVAYCKNNPVNSAIYSIPVVGEFAMGAKLLLLELMEHIKLVHG